MSDLTSALADVGRALIRRGPKQEALEKQLQPVTAQNAFWGFVRESFTGAWQTNVVINRDEILSYFAVYACISLISQDVSKMRIKLTQEENGVWQETKSPAFSPVLKKPNVHQTRIKFIESWLLSKLINGNAYILKSRDDRGVVIALWVLDPQRVLPLVSTSGDVFYQLQTDQLGGIAESDITVPAREIIHDRGACLFHPLLGVSPIYACSLAATQGIKIQANSSKLFTNMSRPSGILTAPGAISDATAARLKTSWDENYGGDNFGKTAVLGDDLKYQSIGITPVDAQLIEQLKMSAEVVCSAFHVPPYMVGIGAMPTYNNIEALNQQYYSQALQNPIESIELLLDEGLGLQSGTNNYRTEFDIDALLRMDTATRFKAHSDGITGGWLAPNEARRRERLKPVQGGDTPYLQQQNYSLEALSKRDQQDDPFGTAEPPSAPPDDDDEDASADAEMAADLLRKELADEDYARVS